MDAFQRAMTESDWSNQCQRVERHFQMMADPWSREAVELVAAKVREFTSQGTPANSLERDRRRSQDWGLTSLIRSVCDIERTVGQYPHRSEDRLRLVKAICSLKLPTNEAETSELKNATWQISAALRNISADEIAFGSR